MTEHEKRTRVDDLSPKRSKVQESSAKSDQAVDINLELDPDLMLEVDISLDNTDRTQSTQSRRISTRSKSAPRKGMFAGSDRNGQTGRSPVYIKTRARPIKPHEPEPFLSIDNLSPDKLQQLMAEKEANSPSKNESRKDQRSKTPVISTNQNYPFWAMAKSPYSSPIPPRKVSRKSVGANDNQKMKWSSSRGGARTPSSMIFLSPNPTSKANQHIKSPFKHAVPKKKDFDDSSTFSERSGNLTPAAEMKERTAVATYCVGRVLSKEKEKPEQRKVQGKLLKGKLKPLKPVNVEGPSINNCRGILSDHITENRSPANPANRTLARRRELIQRIPNIHEYLYDRPRTVESIHRTSAASSIDENREIKDDDGSPLNTSRMSPIESDINMPAAPPASMATTYKVVDGMPQPTPTPRNLTELQSTSTRENFLKKGDSGSVLNENSFRRLEQDNTLMTTFEEAERPETPGDKTKNVRFADGVHPEKTVKESTEDSIQDEKVMNVEVTIKGQDKKDKKEKGKSTCKTSDSNNVKNNDGNEDPDGHGGGGSGGNNSNEKETSQSSSNSEGKSEAKNEENKENYGKQNSGSPQSGKCNEEELKIEAAQLLVGEKAKKPSANTHYTLISSSHQISTPSVLNIQSVIHGGSIHQLVGPESPHRSRSPSPSRSPTRSKTPSGIKSKSDKTNKLIRPSSANQQTRKSRRLSKESQSSTNTLTARKSKVHFEGEKPPRQSVFVETAECDGISVGLKEERALTFEEIEAELNFIKEDIEERRKFEDMERISIDSDDQSATEEENMDLICLPTANEPESVNEDISDYSSLLDVYRKKCMEVSENCGVLSDALTSARRNVARPRSGGEWKERREYRNTGSRRNSFHFERTPHSSRSEAPSWPEHGSLKHTTSDISIADSGYSMASSDVSRKEESAVPRLNLQVEETSDIGQTESDRTEDKTLLELVCDELPDVQQAFGDLPEKKNQSEKVDLEVVANPKEIQKSKVKRRTGPTQAAPFAPLCFTVNARPPDGYVYYFAYGADMNPSRISTYIQRTVENRFWGLLFGFNLVFNKKGSDLEAGAFANIEFNPFCSTEGCIYQITPQELELLDKFVGYPKHYEHLMLPVWMMNSKETDEFGVAQYCVPAVMYIAQQEWIAKDEEKLDCDYALTQCIKSSDLVTPDYREYLVNKGGPIEIKT